MARMAEEARRQRSVVGSVGERMPVALQIQTRRRELNPSSDDILRFARRARTAAGLKGTISIIIESNDHMQAMNRHFRGKNKPTDVLSFPAPSAVHACHAGDIAISADIAAANARSLGHSFADEIKVLILHGMIHLAGHDHEGDSGQMARLERRLRAQLRLPDSLTERARAKTAPTASKPASGRKPARIKAARSSSRKARVKGRTSRSTR
jgi:probable rRNA maturation factor